MKLPLSAQQTGLLLDTEYLATETNPSIYILVVPRYNQDFLLCLALDSAPTWSISNSGPALTAVSLLCVHLDEGIRGSLLESYLWTMPSSLPGKPGFDS